MFSSVCHKKIVFNGSQHCSRSQVLVQRVPRLLYNIYILLHIWRIAVCLCPNLRYKILLSGCVSTSERIRIGVQNTRVGYFTFFKHNLFNFTVRWLVLVESNQKQLQWGYLWRYSAWSVWHLWPNQQWCWLDTWKPNGDGKGWFRANPRNGVELQHQPWSGWFIVFFLFFFF